MKSLLHVTRFITQIHRTLRRKIIHLSMSVENFNNSFFTWTKFDPTLDIWDLSFLFESRQFIDELKTILR